VAAPKILPKDFFSRSVGIKEAGFVSGTLRRRLGGKPDKSLFIFFFEEQ
jgi:hypothetical protein